MTTKGTSTVDSTGSLSLAQLPPQISLASPLLASVVRLPADPLIAYTIFQPSDTLDPSLHLPVIESARRSLVSDSRSVLKSLLFTVKILPRLSLLYVFAISSSHKRSPPHDALLNLKIDGLDCMSSFLASFTRSLTQRAMPIPNLHSYPQPPPVLFSPSRDFTRAVPLVLLPMSRVLTVWPPLLTPSTPPTPRFCHDPSHANSPVPHCELYTRNCCRVSVNSYPIG